MRHFSAENILSFASRGRTGIGGSARGLTGAEERLAGSIEQVRRYVYRLARAQQAAVRLPRHARADTTDVRARTAADAKPQAVARDRERHGRLLKAAGRGVLNESSATMRDLISQAE